jgi:hypothetical protein
LFSSPVYGEVLSAAKRWGNSVNIPLTRRCLRSIDLSRTRKRPLVRGLRLERVDLIHGAIHARQKRLVRSR